MSQHKKSLTQKQKIVMYVSAALLAIVAAIIAVIVLVIVTKNPPPSILNSSVQSNTSQQNSTSSSSTEQLPNTDTVNSMAQIKGIKNGTIYYTTQCVTVIDDNITSILLNGQEQNKQFFIDGNITNMYVIETTDTDGNVITYVVYTKPISSLLDPIRHLNEYTVTLDDYDIIAGIKSKALSLETKYSPKNESVAIDEVVSFCDRYLIRLDALTKDIDEITNIINEYKENPPLSSDMEAINQVIQKIDSLISNGNLNANQYKTLQNMKAKCQSWLINISPDKSDIENIE